MVRQKLTIAKRWQAVGMSQAGFSSRRVVGQMGVPGADPGFQVRGAHFKKKSRRAEGGAKNVGVFRVKNHDFTPKNYIFSNFRRARAGCAPLDPPLGTPFWNLSSYTVFTSDWNGWWTSLILQAPQSYT